MCLEKSKKEEVWEGRKALEEQMWRKGTGKRGNAVNGSAEWKGKSAGRSEGRRGLVGKTRAEWKGENTRKNLHRSGRVDTCTGKVDMLRGKGKDRRGMMLQKTSAGRERSRKRGTAGKIFTYKWERRYVEREGRYAGRD